MFSNRLGKAPPKSLAIDALRANVMMADADFTITYLNPALASFLREIEADLRRELPAFDVNKLVGSNIDIFHKTPSHQRAMLTALEAPHTATIRVGRHAFDLRVVPLKRGTRRSGFVVEWANADERLLNLDYAAQIAAIGRSQAIIAFTVDGEIIQANENFLKLIGYKAEELRGQNHSLFVEPAHRASREYAAFWANLRAGIYQMSEFKRIAKDGSTVWVQGSYNPILDEEGRVSKVVKFATDVTPRVRAVATIGTTLAKLAGGDLSTRIQQPLTPELDKLRTDLNSALDMLQSTMQRISAASTAIQTGGATITGAADNLSRRTEQQAAALEQGAAALDEITATVRKTAEGTKHAREVVSVAREEAERSGRVVAEAVVAMGAIKTSSEEIAQIIGVIDEIAFQTNLLALNAGVEAARAGEAGRGFAVVASEVRALAQRSAEAAKEIKGLIGASSTHVGAGVTLVGETGRTLTKIMDQVTEINSVVTAIATSAQEQATGLGEVNIAVNQMDQVTQQNAAMVEEVTTTSHSLASEAEQLVSLVGIFNVGEAAAPPVPARKPSCRPLRPATRGNTALQAEHA